MEEENKISFWKKIRISILGLEDYQKLAIQKTSKTIVYLAKLMLIFAFTLSTILTFKLGITLKNVNNYIQNEISEINFENNILDITPKNNTDKSIIIENEDVLNGKLIIDTGNLEEEKINSYIEEIKGYTNGILVLKDKVVFKTAISAVSSNIYYKDIALQYNIVRLDKQEIVNILSGSSIWGLYLFFFVTMCIYLFIIYFSTILLDALLYSIFAYIVGAISKLFLKYSATYNIAAYALTLPIALNLAYIVVNSLTGYTIKYFDIMYIAITCIYIITSILMIKSDMIKKQMELSKIISEQEKIKAEMLRKEQEQKEEEEKERLRKEDEKKRQEEKNKKDGKNKDEGNKNDNNATKKKRTPLKPKQEGDAQPEANIVTRN